MPVYDLRMALTDQEESQLTELLPYIDDLIPEDGVLEYDFSDQKQFDFAGLVARMTSDCDVFPGILASLEHARANPSNQASSTNAIGGWHDLYAIQDHNPSKKTAARGIATIVGGYGSMNLGLIVVENGSSELVAQGSSYDFCGALIYVRATKVGDKPIPSDTNAFMQYIQTPRGHELGPENFSVTCGLVKRTSRTAVNPVPNSLNIVHPSSYAQNPRNPESVSIGLGRAWNTQGWNNGDPFIPTPGSTLDYAWNQDQTNTPIGQVPFSGSMEFAEEITSDGNGTPGSGFAANITIIDRQNGGATFSDLTKNLTSSERFQIDSTDTKKLTWAFSPGVDTSDTGSPVKFGEIEWPSDTVADFRCEITVPTDGGNVTTHITSEFGQKNPSDFMPIEFVWHCLAEGTLVTMNNDQRSGKPIEKLAVDHVVRTGGGGEKDFAKVIWTNKGVHKGPVTHLETEQGRKLVVSNSHVLFTTKKDEDARRAEELEVGDPLWCGGDEFDTIKDIRHDDEYTGLMYNLATRDYHGAHQHDEEIARFMANGIVVGDINAQRMLAHKRGNDINWVKAHVAGYLGDDVDAYFAAKQG